MSVENNLGMKENEVDSRVQNTKQKGTLSGKKDVNDAAREEAMGEIEADADLGIHDKNNDLDEGETAGLGEKKNDLV